MDCSLPQWLMKITGKVWFFGLTDQEKYKIPRGFIQILKLGTDFIPYIGRKALEQNILQVGTLNKYEFDLITDPHNKKRGLNDDGITRYLIKIRPTLDNVTILECDKNMGSCIIKTPLLDKLVMDILDTNSFNLVEKDQTSIIEEYCNEIDSRFKDLQKILSIEHYKLPKMRVMPKAHKTPLKVRPIIGAARVYTTNLAIVLDQILKPIMERVNKINTFNVVNTSSYIKRLELMNQEIIENTLNVKNLRIDALDFDSMYTNIKHDVMLENIDLILCMFRGRIDDDHFRKGRVSYFISNDRLMSMIRMYLKYNYFTFLGLVYYQTIGIPTGGNCSPLLANLYLSAYEIKFIAEQSAIYEPYRFSGRYLDDLIIMAWIFTYCNSTIKNIYNNDMGITPTNDRSDNSEIFLDLMITIDYLNNCITWKLYRKEGNCYNYPEIHTYLPLSCKKGFIMGEIQRIYRNFMKSNDIVFELEFFFKKLVSRGYKQWILLKLLKKHVKLIKEPRPEKKIDYNQKWIVVKYSEILKRKTVENLLSHEHNNPVKLAFTNHKKIARYV